MFDLLGYGCEPLKDGKMAMLSAAEETAALIRGEGKKMLRKERKQKIETLRSELGLADLQRTPKVCFSYIPIPYDF